MFLNEVDLFEEINKKNERTLFVGADNAYKILATVKLYSESDSSVFVVCRDEYEAKKLHGELNKYISDNELIYYPKDTLYFTFADSISRQITNQRLRAIISGLSGEKRLIVLSVFTLSENRLFFDKSKISKYSINDEVNLELLTQMLVELGYTREHLVESAGQFSIRGGILDFYPPNKANPYRIEFFGNEIDSIRVFNVDSQLTIENVDNFEVIPFAEVVISDELKQICIQRIREDARCEISKVKDEEINAQMTENAQELFERMQHSIDEALRLIYMYSGEELRSILSLFDNAKLILIEPSLLKSGFDQTRKNVHTDFMLLKEKGLSFNLQNKVFSDYRTIASMINERETYLFSSLSQVSDDFVNKNIINIGCADLISYKANISVLVKQIPSYIVNNYTVLFVAEDDNQLDALKNLLSTFSVNYKLDYRKSNVCIVNGGIYHGFDNSTKKIVVIPYSYVESKEIKKPKEVSNKAHDEFFADIKPGDYVVHDLYGIGQYEGINQIELEGVVKDYIKITYAKEDILYIPPEQLDKLQKYIGSVDTTPKLTRLGTNEWANSKRKVQSAVKELASEYVQMYAKRQKVEGFAFSEDTSWQKEFEDSFRFEATAGQVIATEEIKADMQNRLPMDRLLCADVGYGKTEVAQRVAFKAVLDSKQVAILVPTTILALQHYNSFVERMKDYPIKIEMVSRLRSAKQVSQIAKDLKSGKIDILIGTHKILSDEIKFKDLGMLIIDEEQRFGVKHKDQLKLLKSNLDTLTLSATPIPRSLHMSLSGIKSISVINTPPANRSEIMTYVVSQDDIIVKEAIMNEMLRAGQVFYLYNRVESIESKSVQLANLVPDARVEFMHGRMTQSQIESRILRFMNKEIDVLVCTVIIENGVDFENCNTIIVEDADKLGLSQLYQLRGRVGRSDRQAYAYMLYKKGKILSDVANKRLQAIKEFTKFGSGFKIAMRDLQIRGAGDIIGAQQHGHFSNVGYEMYSRLLAQAVKEEKNEPCEIIRDTEIDISLDLFIPVEYIPSEEQRIDMYKAIALISSDDDVAQMLEELTDRYSDVPECVVNLCNVSYLKSILEKCSVKKIRQVSELEINFEFFDGVMFTSKCIEEIAKKHSIRLKNSKNTTVMIYYLDKRKELIGQCLEFALNLFENMTK